MLTRWKVVIRYKPEHMADEVHYIEELEELHALIERGPDWNHIDTITITLNR